MINTPLISIIVPVYKTEKQLPRCIESILGQTVSNLELILIDDGSPDNCGKICDEYARRDSRVKVIHQVNKGLSNARNAGLEVARGELIGFVDSDDYIEPDMYEYLYQLICRDDASMAQCNICEDEGFRPDRVIEQPYALIRSIDLFQLADWVQVWSKLYKRELLTDVRFKPALSFGEDEVFVFELAKKNFSVALGSEAKYHYCCSSNAGSLTHTFHSTHLNKIILVEQFLEYAKNHNLTTYYQTRSLEQLKHASMWLLHLLHADNPSPEDVAFLTQYIRPRFSSFLRAKPIPWYTKVFVSMACINFNLTRPFVRVAYYLKEKFRF